MRERPAHSAGRSGLIPGVLKVGLVAVAFVSTAAFRSIVEGDSFGHGLLYGTVALVVVVAILAVAHLLLDRR